MRRYASDEKPRPPDLSRTRDRRRTGSAPLRAAVGGGRDAPFRLGSPRDVSEGARDARVDARCERALGAPGAIHGAPDGLRADAHAAARRREGPAAPGLGHGRGPRPPARARARNPGRASPRRGRAEGGDRPEGADRGPPQGARRAFGRARRVREGRRRARPVRRSARAARSSRRRGDGADEPAQARRRPSPLSSPPSRAPTPRRPRTPAPASPSGGRWSRKASRAGATSSPPRSRKLDEALRRAGLEPLGAGET